MRSSCVGVPASFVVVLASEEGVCVTALRRGCVDHLMGGGVSSVFSNVLANSMLAVVLALNLSTAGEVSARVGYYIGGHFLPAARLYLG